MREGHTYTEVQLEHPSGEFRDAEKEFWSNHGAEVPEEFTILVPSNFSSLYIEGEDTF